MIAEILATGDEIRSGALVDSNSAYIAQKLEETGIEVVRHSCIGDDPSETINILTEMGQRSDIAVVTGGLGPTDDDLISAAAARAAILERVAASGSSRITLATFASDFFSSGSAALMVVSNGVSVVIVQAAQYTVKPVPPPTNAAAGNCSG